MNVCHIAVKSVWAGPLALAWGIAMIALLSALSYQALEAIDRLPRWLTAPVLVPAVVWHELCHATGSLIFGHRIEHIQLLNHADQQAHVRYRYDPFSFIQRLGTAFSGWAPVLISSSLILWLLGQNPGLPLYQRALLWYAIVVLALAMPLSCADWKAAMRYSILFVLLSILAGSFLWPHGMTICRPWTVFAQPLDEIAAILAGIWCIGMAFGRRTAA